MLTLVLITPFQSWLQMSVKSLTSSCWNHKFPFISFFLSLLVLHIHAYCLIGNLLCSLLGKTTFISKIIRENLSSKVLTAVTVSETVILFQTDNYRKKTQIKAIKVLKSSNRDREEVQSSCRILQEQYLSNSCYGFISGGFWSVEFCQWKSLCAIVADIQ